LFNYVLNDSLVIIFIEKKFRLVIFYLYFMKQATK